MPKEEMNLYKRCKNIFKFHGVDMGGGESAPEVENAIETHGLGWTEGEVTTIEWDGDTSGRDEIHIHTPYDDMYFYKVAEKEPSYSNTATCTINKNGETIISEFELTDYTGCRVYGDTYSVAAIIADGGELKIGANFTAIAPTAGLYFLRVEYENDDGEGTVINYPSSLTYTAETIHKIDQKYIPGGSGGAQYDFVIVSEDGETYSFEKGSYNAIVSKIKSAPVTGIVRCCIDEYMQYSTNQIMNIQYACVDPEEDTWYLGVIVFGAENEFQLIINEDNTIISA